MNLPSTEEFNYRDCRIGGDECVFISAKNITTKWTKDNLIYRSIILRKSDHYVINSSFKKFYNYLEQPDIEPFPTSNFTAVGKMDGSTLIFGYHNGELIARTRGTLSVKQLNNGQEIDFLEKKYPKLFQMVRDLPNYSILCEWETSSNYIVLRRVKEPTLTLTGIIDNRTLKYISQDSLNSIAESWGVDSPKTYKYKSIPECIADVETWRGLEGVVVYSECGQYFRKIKALEYLALHKLLSGMKTVGNVLDVFMESPRFINPEDFHKFVETTIDYEVASQCKDFIERICRAYYQVTQAMRLFENMVKTKVEHLETRREQALYIQKYCDDWQVPFAFLILDNKPPDDKIIRRAIETYL